MTRSKGPHTHFRQHTHVFVQLRDGRAFDDNFEERKGRFVYLRTYGKLDVVNIRAMSIYRHSSTNPIAHNSIAHQERA